MCKLLLFKKNTKVEVCSGDFSGSQESELTFPGFRISHAMSWFPKSQIPLPRFHCKGTGAWSETTQCDRCHIQLTRLMAETFSLLGNGDRSLLGISHASSSVWSQESMSPPLLQSGCHLDTALGREPRGLALRLQWPWEVIGGSTRHSVSQFILDLIWLSRPVPQVPFSRNLGSLLLWHLEELPREHSGMRTRSVWIVVGIPLACKPLISWKNLID